MAMIRRLTLILFMLLMPLSSLVSAQADWAQVAQQAEQHYQNGDYVTAAALYESLIELGVRDPAVYINLGHSYYESQDLGRALLNYRRSQVLHPRDNALSADLARARSLRNDIQGDETVLVDSLALLTTAIVTATELNWIMLGLWIAFFALLCLFILRVQSRDALRGVTIVLFLLLVLGMVLWGSRAYVTRFRPAAVIVSSRVPVMSGPGEQYLELYELSAAAELRILEHRDNWVRFVLPDQRQGWLPAAALEQV